MPRQARRDSGRPASSDGTYPSGDLPAGDLSISVQFAGKSNQLGVQAGFSLQKLCEFGEVG
jgi:hypothetical protein